jgi:hypothetical protein
LEREHECFLVYVGDNVPLARGSECRFEHLLGGVVIELFLWLGLRPGGEQNGNRDSKT